MFLGFHMACAIYFSCFGDAEAGELDKSWWLRFLLVSTVLLVVGVADDRWQLRPQLKLTGQILVGILAYALDLRFGFVMGTPLPFVADFFLTLVWFLVFINVFNLIDGMDGVATGLALIASVGIMISLAVRGQAAEILPILALTGAAMSFLRYNFHPARIFLGDSGSMFLGLALAAIAMHTASKSALLPSLLVPLMAVGVPLFDTLLAVWRRGVRQRGRVTAILEGDADHLHHRLTRDGLSQRQVAGLLYLFSGALILIGLLLMTLRSYVIGISLTAFVGGVYVVVRHLARVELWDTGNAILRGLQRPPRRVVAVLLYPLADVLILAGVLMFAAHHFSDNHQIGSLLRLMQHAVIWVGVPFLILVVAGTYRRVWSQAGAAEYILLIMALVAGLLLAGGMSNLLLDFAARTVLDYLMVYGALSIAALTGIRCIRPVLLDFIVYRRPHYGADTTGRRRLLIYGTGDRAMLFLREQASVDRAGPNDEQVVGLLANDSNLHGRLIHGYEVLGGLDWLLQESNKSAFDEIVVVSNPDPEERTRLLEVVHQQNLALSEWGMERRPVNGITQ